MERPDVGEYHNQARMWTDDQRLVDLVANLGGVSSEYLTDVSPEVVDYALAQVADLRRELLKMRRDRSVTCRSCGEAFPQIRSTAVYCSGACRQHAHRHRS